MPKVPAGSGQVVPMVKPPEDVYLAMAAAQMDEGGRLFESNFDHVFDPTGENAQAHRALKHADENKVGPNEVFEHGGESWVRDGDVIERASEGQIINNSTKKLRRE